MRWELYIDVGGTFTDVLARRPDGELLIAKFLSSGVVKGQAEAADASGLVDPARRADPEGFWLGATVRLDGGEARRVAAFDRATGRIEVAPAFATAPAAGARYELVTGDEAPILAIRWLMGLAAGAPIPPCDVRLGTTRGTNALLERRGARTALVTTRGFGDVLAIGTQERPRLFELAIRKPPPVHERVVEIDERVAVDGQVLAAPDRAAVRSALREAREAGVRSLAVCLLHGFAHPAHERLVAEEAAAAGFTEVSLGSEVAPFEKIVARAQTTVVDAYLNPVLRAYVAGLRAALGDGATLRLMTSAGGLVDGRRFRGKDSLLSGPAGGVVGYAAAAEAAGIERAIGFDMGGTSTDVSRWDGAFELEYEGERAGVRLVAPMMAIETVAAGGGSICRFDGVKLVVGPASAGADPGPACYGRGGPLTVTDVNVLSGRIPPERFPFPLDLDGARRRLEEIRTAMGGGVTAEELVRGFREVANATMVRAIRAVSVARGVDPAEYALVCFGGAGAQHACAIAAELRMRRVLVPALAGLLSAYGIGRADVRRFGERSVLAPYDAGTLAELEPVFAELEARARAEVEAEGASPARILPPRRRLDLRYAGYEAPISVERPGDGDWRAAYERVHRRLYGYAHEGRALEVVAARVEVVGRGADLPLSVRAEPRVVDGPAILTAAGTTIVVEPGWRAEVRASGDVMLERAAEKGGAAGAAGAAAPGVTHAARLEIFNHQFAAIAEQMGLVLQRTAGSVNVKERLDYSCALFTAEGDLVVNAPHIPVHLGAMAETVRAVLAGSVREGDVFVTNDPYAGGSHLPDVTVVTPVFVDGRLRFFVASRAHHAEIGGIVPGSMPPFSRRLEEEGVVIPRFALVEGGVSREAELRALLASGPWPSRRIDDNLQDLRAQVAANQAGAAALLDLCARHGTDEVAALMRAVQDAAAEKLRASLMALAPGRRTFEDHLDDGTPIAVAITVGEDGRATIDFGGTGPAVDGNLNANRAIVTACVLYVFRCLIGEEIPLNSGVLAPLEVIVPPGSLLDPPRGRAVVGGNVETSQRIVDVLLGALGLAAASQGTMNNLAFGDETFGYYETIAGGAGATPDADGADAVHTHMTNTRLTDPEVLERRYPVRLRRFAIRRGSGGAGARRGGDGVHRELEFLRPLRVSILSERRGPYAPYGVAGGAPGALGRNLLQRAGATSPDLLPGKLQLDVVPGDILTLQTPGGGAWGPVSARSRSRGRRCRSGRRRRR